MVEAKIPGILNLKEALERRLLTKGKSLLEEFPMTRYMSHLHASAPSGSYHSVSPLIGEMCVSIAKGWGEAALDSYHRLLLVNLLMDLSNRKYPLALPPLIEELYAFEFRRIISELDTNSFGFYLFPNDLFCKDLGLCRLKLVPVGSQLIEIGSGISRQILFKGKMRQFIKGIRFFSFQARGFFPYFQIHLDNRKAAEFNEHERTLCYLNIAEILKLNEYVKGLIGGSWFYDPQLERVSPRLTYLRKLPLDNGGQVFFDGSNMQALENALHKSPTRRKLYESGQYHPANYLMVWPRRELMAWAESYQAHPPHGPS